MELLAVAIKSDWVSGYSVFFLTKFDVLGFAAVLSAKLEMEIQLV